MDKLKKLQAELAEVDGKLDALLAHDELTDDQQAEHDRLAGEHERIVKAIANEKGRIARAAERESIAGDLSTMEGAGTGRKAQADPAGNPKPRVEVKEPVKFATLGEQLRAVARAEMSQGRVLDNRLTPLMGPTGASEAVGSDGGYLVQKDFVNQLSGKMAEMGQILSRCDKVTISSNSNGLVINTLNETSRATGSRWGGVQVYWGNEADSATAKKPAFRQTELRLKKLIGLAYATDEILADAAALESVFGQAFAEEMSFSVEDAVVRGTGAGQPLGILAAGCTVSVSKETGQAAATIVYENLQKMWARMYARSRASAAWFINQDCEPQLNGMSLTVGTGGVPVYLPPGGLSSSPYATLLGRPVIPVEYCSTLGTVGDIILADFSQYAMIEKGGMEADSSMHVKFVNYEQTFRYVYRCDGMPKWNSALTPYKGTNTQSPFITLATRS